MKGLAGRSVVVTGGASGIGLATVRFLQDEGAAVAIIDRDAEGAEAVGVPWVQADLADPEVGAPRSCRRLVNSAASTGW